MIKSYFNMFNLKSFLLLCLLSFSTQQGQCGRLCLEVWEDEVHGRTFSRVYRVLNDFFVKHNGSINSLKNEEFFKKTNYQTPSLTAQNILQSIIAAPKASTIEEDYTGKKGLAKLTLHLSELNESLKEINSASDLNNQNFSSLRQYTVALWKIASALQS